MMHDKYMHESFLQLSVNCSLLRADGFVFFYFLLFLLIFYFIYASINKHVSDGFPFCRVAGCLRADLPEIEDVEHIETFESTPEVETPQGTGTAINNM